MSVVLAVANQKGGVAKTTTVHALGDALVGQGRRVLLVDLDPQASLTWAAGIDTEAIELSLHDVLLHRAKVSDVLVKTGDLHVVPSSIDVAGAEMHLLTKTGREYVLRRALEPVLADYDLVLIDCPPSLGLLTVNALAAAHDLIAPVQCEYYALEGLGQLLGNAERVRQALNPDLRVTAFVMTMYDGRTKLSAEVTSEVRSHFGDLVLRTVIPRSVRVSEAPSYGEPVLTLDPSARGSTAYRLLAEEVDERYGLSGRRARARQEEPAGTAAPARAEEAVDRVVAPGPAGRGWGTVTSVPPGLESAWPVREPWSGS
jgi:chromosome partitioning protein